MGFSMLAKSCRPDVPVAVSVAAMKGPVAEGGTAAAWMWLGGLAAQMGRPMGTARAHMAWSWSVE